MNKVICFYILLFSILNANEKFAKCSEKELDKYTKIFICGDEQYLVEYDDTDSNSKIVQKITLINNGKYTVIKKRL